VQRLDLFYRFGSKIYLYCWHTNYLSQIKIIKYFSNFNITQCLCQSCKDRKIFCLKYNKNTNSVPRIKRLRDAVCYFPNYPYDRKVRPK
jgi:hypothetical protein